LITTFLVPLSLSVSRHQQSEDSTRVSPTSELRSASPWSGAAYAQRTVGGERGDPPLGRSHRCAPLSPLRALTLSPLCASAPPPTPARTRASLDLPPPNARTAARIVPIPHERAIHARRMHDSSAPRRRHTSHRHSPSRPTAAASRPVRTSHRGESRPAAFQWPRRARLRRWRRTKRATVRTRRRPLTWPAPGPPPPPPSSPR